MLLLRPLSGVSYSLISKRSSSVAALLSKSTILKQTPFIPNPSYRFTTHRFKSTISTNTNKGSQQPVQTSPKSGVSAEIYEKQQIISRRIPGEKQQSNTLEDRFPSSLKFEKEAIPTLLPRPGVPEPNKYPLVKMYEYLLHKQEPELIYEAEPHRLYFVACYAFALVFTIYSINAFHIGSVLADGIFKDNDMNLTDFQNTLQFIMHTSIVWFCASLPFLVGLGFALFPSRLIRRMWYLPGNSMAGKEPYVRFTTHPIFPYRPSPVHTMPLHELRKSMTAKIYSGKGFYGVNDSSFFFFLREQGKRIPFVVDRKGFFWGDGRIFDLLFSNDSIEKVENSKKIDEMYADMLKLKKENEDKLKRELGFGWRSKAKGKLLLEDIQKIKDIVSDQSVPVAKPKDNKKKQQLKKH